jgi:hypothetical protein
MRLARSAALALLLTLAVAPAASAHGVSEEGEVNHTDTGFELRAADINRTMAVAGMSQAVAPDLPQFLPTTWCGTDPATSDDTANAAFAASQRQIKVVYAYASDQANHFTTWRDSLQADVSRIEQYLALQTGGRRALRFDMGTSCGPQYLDITVVALPQPSSYYFDSASFPDQSTFDHLAQDVWGALGALPGPRDVFILTEGLTSDPTWGIAEVTGDDRASASNISNGGGFTASMWTPAGEAPNPMGWQPTVMLHEITHNLGGVEQSAPHHTSGWHCWDGSDVMCYDDGSSGSQYYTTSMCLPNGGNAITDTYDCGHDDYFNPDPPAGSYLATHWNLYDSDFFGSCSQLGMACGDNIVPTIPVNTAPPSVGGTAKLGAILSASAGTWLNRPTSYAVQWQRTAGDSWVDIAGASRASYVPTTADVGAALRIVVTATNEDGAAAVASGATAAIAGAPTPPPPAPAAKPKASPSPRTLQIALRDRKHHKAGTLSARITVVAAGQDVRTASARVKLPAGRWRLKLCAGAKRGPLRCSLGRRVRTRTHTVKLPAGHVTVRGVSGGALQITASAVDGRQRVRASGQAATT